MDTQVPILDASGVVEVEELTSFLEVLDAVIDGQWLMVAPRMTLRLQKDFEFKVKYLPLEELIGAIGTPFYWRGPFVGMRVKPATSEELNRARRLRQTLLARADQVRVSEVNDDASGGRTSHTSYAMVDSQPESLFPNRVPTQREPVAEPAGPAPEDAAPEPPGEPVLREPPTEPRPEPERALSPVVIEDDRPAVDSTSTPDVGDVDHLPAVVPPQTDFTPVAPPEKSPLAGAVAEAPDPSEYTETDYLDLAGAASPLAPDAAAPGAVVEPADLVVSIDHAVEDAPAPVAESPQAAPPVATPPRAPAPLSRTAAPAAPDLDAPIPELRGVSSGGFVEKDLLVTFPDKSQGISLVESPTLYRLMSVLAAFEVAGQLTLKKGDQEAALFLRSGTLLGLDPMGTTFDQLFAERLLAEKAIEQGPLDQATAHALAFEKTLPVALYEKRTIGMDVMGRVLRDLKQEALFALLTDPDPIEFHFVARRKFGRKFDPMRLHLAAALVEFVRTSLARKYLADLEPLLADYKFKYAQVRDDAAVSIDVLSLDDKQRHAVKHVLHGPNRLNETYSLCLLTRHGTARLITLLHHFGLIKWLDAPGEVAGAETIEDRLKTVLRHLQAGDHFKRLEVHWGAHPRKIDAAMERFSGKYAATTALARHSEEAGQLCASIMGLVTESHTFLAQKRQRRAYRLEMQGDQRVRRAAEFLVKQADLVRFRGDWQEAFDLLEAAIDMWEHPSFVSKHQQWRAERKG